MAILKQAGISATLNHFTSFELGPWSRESAAGCLRALANSYRLSFEPDAIETMLDHLGLCVPHHVQVYFEAVYQHCLSLHIRQVPKAIVSNVYAQRMLSIRGHVELSHFEERLRMVLGPNLHPLALDLLTEAAVANGLTEFAARIIAHDHLALDDRPLEQLRQILAILEHDGYLNKAASDRYVFASRLLRDWWHARFSFAFTPVSRRSPRESQ